MKTNKCWMCEQILNLWTGCLFFAATAMQIHISVPGMEWSGWRQKWVQRHESSASDGGENKRK